MKKIKINDIELQIDDGIEITIDSAGSIKIHSKPINWTWCYPTVTKLTDPITSEEPYKITWTSNFG